MTHSEVTRSYVAFDPATQEALKSISSRTKHMQHTMDDLQRQKEAIPSVKAEERARYAKPHNNNIPIPMLPSEILAIIFGMADDSARLEWSQHDGGDTTVALGKTGAAVSSVSKYWRAVAVSTGKLWDSICVDSRRIPEVSILSEILQRSKGSVLSLTVYFDKDCGFDTAGELAVIVDVLCAHVDRWQTLVIHASSIMVSTLLGRLRPARAMMLHRIILSLDPEGDLHWGHGPFGLFTGGAPSLKHLSYLGFGPGFARPVCTSITTLRLHDIDFPWRISFAALGGFLQAFRSLESLDIRGDFVTMWPYDNALVDAAPTLLPSLRSLSFHMLRSDLVKVVTVKVLAFIQAPLLDAISFCGVDSFGKALCEVVAQPLPDGGTRFPVLRTVTLTDCFLDTFDWSDLSIMFPRVEHMVYTASEGDHIPLLCDEDGHFIAVHLRKLTLRCPCVASRIYTLCSVLEARRRSDFVVPAICIPPSVLRQIPQEALAALERITTVEETEFTDGIGEYASSIQGPHRGTAYSLIF